MKQYIIISKKDKSEFDDIDLKEVKKQLRSDYDIKFNDSNNIVFYRNNTSEIYRKKQEKINKLLIYLEENDKITYADRHICNFLEISQRTLNRYIKELAIKEVLKIEKVAFSNGGRGYKIEKVISKKKRSKKQI